MATTNPVNQVLVTSGNQALLAAGSRPEALAIGQLGIFNYHTGLSIDGSVPADAKDIFLAVGIDPLGVGSIQDINKSAGQMIQVKHGKTYTFKGYVPAISKVIDVMGFTARCEEDYALKIEFRNGQIYQETGYNQFAETFAYRTACCSDPCADCASGNCAELALGIGTNINSHPDHLATATYIVNAITATVAAEPTAAGNIVVRIGTATVYTDYTVAIVDADTVTTAAAKIVAVINAQANSPYFASNLLGVMTIYPKVSTQGSTETLVYQTPVAGMTITPIVAATKTVVADTAAFTLANPGVCLGIRITSNSMAVNAKSGGINLKYVKNRQTDMIISSPIGFTCNGTITTLTELQMNEGSGYDIQQLEYEAGGFNGKPGPYRQSTITGMERQGITYFASATANYNVFVLSYDQQSVGGWLEYLNNLETIIAVPCADNTTLAGIPAVLDLIFTQFGAMAGDVAANGDCTNTRTGLLTPATDGIESLA